MNERNMVKKFAILLMTIVMLFAVVSPVGAAPVGLVNGGFEEGNFNSWAVGGTSYNVASSWGGYTAPYGNYFAVLTGDTEMAQSFTASAGDTISGKAFFKAADYMPYNDFGKVIIEQNGTVLFYRNVSQVGNFGSTPWTEFNFTFTSAGTYTIRAMVHNAIDAGVWSTVGLDLDYASDTIAPVTTDNAPADWQKTDVTVTLSASDAGGSGLAATYYTVNGGSEQTGTSVELTEGMNTLIYWSVDNAGNIEDSNSATIKIDKTLPVTEASTNLEANYNGWFNEEVTITLTATDNLSGVANTFYSVDGAAIQSGTSIIISSEGNHVVTYWSVDVAGNVEAEQTLNINIDTTAPELIVTLDTSTLWAPNHKLVEITAATEADGGLSGLESLVLTSIESNELDYDPGTVDDDVAGDIQEAAFGEEDTNFLLRAERSGEGIGRVYTITYKATDKAGNQTSVIVLVEVPHDKGNNKEVPKGKKK